MAVEESKQHEDDKFDRAENRAAERCACVSACVYACMRVYVCVYVRVGVCTCACIVGFGSHKPCTTAKASVYFLSISNGNQ